MNNTGKLTTPSGEGASIEVYENGTYGINGIINNPLLFNYGRLWDHTTSDGGQEYQLTMGADRKEGAYLSLRTQDESNGDYKGAFFLGAVDVSNNLACILRGLPNGSISWCDRYLSLIDTFNANTNGFFIRYTNGFTIQSGIISIGSVPASGGASAVVTLPLLMNSVNYTITITSYKGGNRYSFVQYNTVDYTTSNFTLHCWNNNVDGETSELQYIWQLIGF